MSKVILRNFASLSFIQVVNFIIPLATVPYTIRIVGVEKYGSIGVSLSLVTFFVVFADYGFNLSATREVSLNRDDNEALSKIISKVLVCKVIILLFALTTYFIIITKIDYFNADLSLFTFSASIILGNSFLPTWFFQGIEKMMPITYLTVFNRVLMAIAIFIFIRDDYDYVYVNLISGLCSLLATVVALFMLFGKMNFTFKIPGHKIIYAELKNGFLIFVSNLSNVVYTFSNILILDWVTGNRTLVGCYSITEKLISMIKQLLIIYSQVIYPHLCQLSKSGRNSLCTFFKKSYTPFLLLIILGSIFTLITAPWIILILAGSYIQESIISLRIMSILPIIIVLNIPSYQILLVYDQKKRYSMIYFSAALISLFSNWILTTNLSYIGTILSVILTELFITIGLFISERDFSRKLNA